MTFWLGWHYDKLTFRFGWHYGNFIFCIFSGYFVQGSAKVCSILRTLPKNMVHLVAQSFSWRIFSVGFLLNQNPKISKNDEDETDLIIIKNSLTNRTSLSKQFLYLWFSRYVQQLWSYKMNKYSVCLDDNLFLEHLEQNRNGTDVNENKDNNTNTCRFQQHTCSKLNFTQCFNFYL